MKKALLSITCLTILFLGLAVPAFADAPAPAADAETTPEDIAVIIDVLGNDTPPTDGDAIDPASVAVPGSAGTLSPANGAVSINITDGKITYTPFGNSNGIDSFDYTVCDDGAVNGVPVECASATVTVTVTAVNDAPTFTTSGDITVDEDFATTESVTVTPDPAPADETGQVVTYSLSPPSVAFANVSINSATGEVTITAVADANGTQLFTITADDGEAANNTATQDFNLTVNPVNDAPTFTTSGDVTVDEDFATTESVTVTPDPAPADETGQIVTYSLSPPSVAFANVSINSATGEVTITAVADANGTQLFTITADDGEAANNTATQDFNLTVNPVNDAPTFTTSGDVTVDEDFATTESVTVTPDPAPADETGQIVTYSLSPPSVAFANVSINSATGEVTITAVADANGTQLFTITADDGEAANNTATQDFNLTVNPVNDAPTFTTSGDVTVDEDFATTESVTVTPDPAPADETGQVVTYSLSPPSVAFANVSINSATGEVTITAVADANGTQLFTITADDGEAANNTATQDFNLTVNPVNDAPSFAKGANENVAEDAGPQSVAGWATGISPGPANESDQSVSFDVTGNTNPALFAAAPAIAPNGDLTYTSAANAFGTANVTITLSDDCGGGTPPASCGTTGIDTSAPQTFTITVANVNDPPSFVSGGNVITETGTGEQTLPWATAISVGPANENQTPSFTVTSDCAPSPLQADPSIDPDGTLRFTPVNLTTGACTVSVTLSDGVDSSVPIDFTLELVLATVPVADPQTVETDGGNPLAITLTGSDPDDQLPLTFQVIEPVTDADTGAIISDSGPFRGTLDTTTPPNATDTSAVVTYTPDEPTISQAAIIATDSFVLEKFADILGGDVVVNGAGGTATMERSTTTPAGFAIRADSLNVHGTATVGGDALCNAGDYAAACDPLTLPVYDLLPPFLVGSVDDNNDVNVPRKGTANLTPGLYGDITVEPEGDLVFAPGKYSMRSLTTDNKADLLFSGATEIKIAERLELASYVEVNAGGAAGDVIFYVAGGDGSDPAAVVGFNNAVFNANVYAPNGTVSIGQDSAVTGAFLGRHVVVGSKATVQLANGFGEAPDEFAFEVTDAIGLRSEQAVVEINPDDSCRDDAGQIVAIAAYAGAAATDGAASIQITLRGCESTDIPVTVTATTPGQGTLGGLPTGPVGPPYAFVVTYTPADPVPNNRDSFDFSFDNGISVATATVEINEPPCEVVEAVTASGFATDEGNPLTITLSGCDPDDGVLAIATDDSNVDASCASCALSAPSGPVLDTRPGHTSYNVVFTHSEVVGQTASFDYTVTGASGAATKTINVEVNPVPVPPVANNDAFNGILGGFVGGNVLTNDTDLNNDPLSASLISGPSHASNFTLNPDGSFVYTHNGTANFSDSFVYSASDGALSDTATVSITLGAISISVTLDKAGPAGSENSRVFTIPAGIDCGNGCPSQTAVFAVTQTINLVAQPATGFLFGGWSGDADCADALLQPIGDRSCTANFVTDPSATPQSVQVTIAKAGGGSGTVVSDPVGVNCGPACPLQTTTVATTAQQPRVKLSPEAASGSVFAGFSPGPGCPNPGVLDCGCGTSGLLTGDLPASCTATFNLAPRVLTIVISGGGTVAGNGIYCTGNPCSASYADGTLVTLSGSSDTSRNPADVSWGGQCTTTPGAPQQATVVMSGARTCTVNFD